MVKHEIALLGCSGGASQPAPVILDRADEDFLAAVLDQLKTEPGRGELARTRAVTRQRGRLLLYQPVHRRFNVALLEAHCVAPGSPRLDPARIESCGLVVRRLAAGHGRTNLEGWLSAGPRLQGWCRFPSPDSLDQDPDSARRLRLSAGHPEIDRRLPVPAGALLKESVAPLFRAPPEICEAARRTLLYGVLPVTSSERSEVLQARPDYGAETPAPGETESLKSKLRRHLNPYLAPGTPGARLRLPRAGSSVRADWMQPAALQADSTLRNFVSLLQQVAVEFDAFGDSPQSRAVHAALNALQVSGTPAGDFLRAAKRILMDSLPGGLVMPAHWPVVSAAQSEAILAAAVGALGARFDQLAGKRARFEELGRRYVARGFVRVRGHPGCPPELVWSAPTEEFSIAPWYEPSASTPPARVSLPNLFKPEAVRALKPTVVFELPEELQCMLGMNTPKDLMEGNGGKCGPGSGFGLDWLCGFSIPIITLCAFIVLHIFLSLLNIIFWWLPFLKICIPIPKRNE